MSQELHEDTTVELEELGPEALAQELERLLEAAEKLGGELESVGVDSKSLEAPEQVPEEPTGESQPTERKSARTFARQIADLAEAEGVGERTGQILTALAVVVSVSKPAEFGALAAILARVAPKAIKDKADTIVEKMARESGQEYGQPAAYPGQYPEPGKKALEQTIADLQAALQALQSRVDALSDNLQVIGEKAEKALAAAPSPIVGEPVARETMSVAAALAARLKGE